MGPLPWFYVYKPDPEACRYVSHKPDWRVLERGFFRRWPGDTRQASQESTVVCLQCVAVWRTDIAVDQIKDFA